MKQMEKTILKSKPLIRWAGSKRKLLPELVEKIPENFDRYVEPFCGSACLFFELRPKRALLADINIELINAFKQIKKIKGLRDILTAIPNTESEYYRLRSMDPKALNVEDQAVRFLYLNRYCFNGVYRTNKAGQFNVPRGKKTGVFPLQEVFDSARVALSKAELKVSGYENTLDSLVEGDFAYIDPPYSKSGRFTGEYGLGSFESNRIPQFIEKLDEINSRGVKFLFSYRSCSDAIKNLHSRYVVEELSVRRHISGFKTGWDDVKEVLVKNY